TGDEEDVDTDLGGGGDLEAGSENESDEIDGVVEATAEVVDDPSESEDAQDLDEGLEKSPTRAGAITRVDPLQQYLREVQRHTLLSPEEEHDLAVKYVKTADVAAAARLVTANLRLVVKLAYEYRRAYKNIMDLIQEGNIGLMQA